MGEQQTRKNMFSTFNEGPLFHYMTCYKKLSAFHLVILKCFTNAGVTLCN